MLILNRFLKCHRSAIRLPATAGGPAQDFNRGPQLALVLRVGGVGVSEANQQTAELRAPTSSFFI